MYYFKKQAQHTPAFFLFRRKCRDVGDYPQSYMGTLKYSLSLDTHLITTFVLNPSLTAFCPSVSVDDGR